MLTKNSYQTAATLLVVAGLIYTAYILSKKVKSVEIEALGLLRVKIEN